MDFKKALDRVFEEEADFLNAKKDLISFINNNIEDKTYEYYNLILKKIKFDEEFILLFSQLIAILNWIVIKIDEYDEIIRNGGKLNPMDVLLLFKQYEIIPLMIMKSGIDMTKAEIICDLFNDVFLYYHAPKIKEEIEMNERLDFDCGILLPIAIKSIILNKSLTKEEIEFQLLPIFLMKKNIKDIKEQKEIQKIFEKDPEIINLFSNK